MVKNFKKSFGGWGRGRGGGGGGVNSSASLVVNVALLKARMEIGYAFNNDCEQPIVALANIVTITTYMYKRYSSKFMLLPQTWNR